MSLATTRTRRQSSGIGTKPMRAVTAYTACEEHRQSAPQLREEVWFGERDDRRTTRVAAATNEQRSAIANGHASSKTRSKQVEAVEFGLGMHSMRR
eukprot:5685142-Pleurochrysis_carterae.AAC.4